MKKILILLTVAFLFCGCSQKVKEEYIPLFIDTETGAEYFVATPSGIIYEKASGSEIKVWHDSQGETRNIYEVQNDREN